MSRQLAAGAALVVLLTGCASAVDPAVESAFRGSWADATPHVRVDLCWAFYNLQEELLDSFDGDLTIVHQGSDIVDLPVMIAGLLGPQREGGWGEYDFGGFARGELKTLFEDVCDELERDLTGG